MKRQTQQPQSSSGYGKDPNLITPSVPWSYLLTKNQRLLVAMLSDIILPVPNEFPQPSQMGIVRFFDEWISAPYPRQQADKQLLLEGFVLIDSLSISEYGKDFVELELSQRTSIVEACSSGTTSDSADLAVKFFSRFRYLLIGGYYTSDIGFKAIRYIGNVPLSEYEGVSYEGLQYLYSQMDRLGLKRPKSTGYSNGGQQQ